MAIEYTQNTFGSAKGLLVFPDHYVAYPELFAYGHALAVTVGTKKIVKAGTIYPANDATAVGIVFSDVDVTNGDGAGAVIIHGFVKTAGLPEVPSANAKSALKGITFLPLTNTTLALTGVKATVAAGAATDPDPVVLTLTGAEFRDGAETLTNWTIAGEATTKLTVTAIEISADNKTATITLDQASAAAAGSVTVLPAATILSGGVTVTAVTIATVA